MKTEKLEMVFSDNLGKSFKISVDDPINDLNADIVKSAMEDIIEKDIFHQKADLEIPKAAAIVERTVSKIF